MKDKPIVNIFWFRRDLRLEDNAGLYHALKAGKPVLPVFIFDTDILDKLQDKDDARVFFIYTSLVALNNQLQEFQSSILVQYGKPNQIFEKLILEYGVEAVFTNDDYEPYARERDAKIASLLKTNNSDFRSFKDHVIFEKNEVVKDDGRPYTVFTPYKRRWLETLRADFHFKAYPVLKYAESFHKNPSFPIPTLKEIGFEPTSLPLPSIAYKKILKNYAELRDYPAIEGTSKIGIHLRFGTVSIREAAKNAMKESQVWLSELIWREFYSMILRNFPETRDHSFKKDFDHIRWRNNEEEFEAWCTGQTGYPIVDAGMRQLNTTGWMHNRVRMIVASFLCKHLLIDWRWGEAYFARKLLDYEMASNVGGWQWAAGTGNDAAPYFRVFNPQLQMEKFDPKMEYIKKWIPEFDDPFKYPKPIVEHKFARDRALAAYKAAITSI
jgi:deoxyribodipyrimidine photo-lyase